MAEISIVPGTIQLLKMTDAEYFSEQYKDYVSNSRLGLFNTDEGGSPEKYEAGFKSEYSASFELGTAIHSMLLQPDYFYVADFHKPTGKLGIFVEQFFKLRQNGATLEEAFTTGSINADYYANKLSPARRRTAIGKGLDFYLKRLHYKDLLDKETIFLPKPIHATYLSCMENLLTNSDIIWTLYPEGILAPADVYNEYAILCEVDVSLDNGEVIRIKIKAKLDNFTINHDTCTITLNDLKTTSKPLNYFMGNYVQVGDTEEKVWYNGSFQKYHYYRQAGMYMWLLQCAIREHYNVNYKYKSNILVIETLPEYASKVFSVNGKYINAGVKEFKQLLITLVEWKYQKLEK